MPIYLIRAGDAGPVKIGFAIDPFRRLQTLQCAHYEPLSILRLWVGGRLAEQGLHNRFAHLRIRNEWFSYSDDMMGDVGLKQVSLADAKREVLSGMPSRDVDRPLFMLARVVARTDPANRSPAEIYDELALTPGALS